MQVARTKVDIANASCPELESGADQGKAEPADILQGLIKEILGERGSESKPVLLIFHSTDKGPDEKKPLPAFALSQTLLTQLTSPTVDVNLGLTLKHQFDVRKVDVDPAKEGQALAKAGLKQFPALVVVNPTGKVIDVQCLSGKMPDPAICNWLSKACKAMGLDVMPKVKAHASLIIKMISLDGQIKSAKTSAASAKGKNKEKFEAQVLKLSESFAELENQEKTIWVEAPQN